MHTKKGCRRAGRYLGFIWTIELSCVNRGCLQVENEEVGSQTSRPKKPRMNHVCVTQMPLASKTPAMNFLHLREDVKEVHCGGSCREVED